MIAVPVLAGMGNALMAQPMVRQLAAARPGEELVVLARNASIAGVFERLGEVSRVEVFGNEPRQFARLLRRLRQLRPGLLVVPYPSNRWQYSLMARASGAARVVMHDYPVGKVRALHGLVRDRVPTREGRHDVLANLDLLRAMGVEADEAMAPAFPLRVEESREARTKLEQSFLGRRSGSSGRASAASRPELPLRRPEAIAVSSVESVSERFCAIHAGSGATVFAMSKRWPPEKFGELIPRLRGLGLTPILLEGPEDVGVGDLLARHTDAPLVRLGGTLADAAAVLAACDLYVGSDSGLAHLAAAVGTPPVTLFGPARPDEVSPYGYRHLVVQTPAACAPCFDYPHRATTPHVRCRPPYCVGQITVDAVMQAFQSSKIAASAAASGTSSARGEA